MQQLQPDATLQGGRYKILKTLGQGGFGITYLAIQSGLERKVAVKEFFMKEHCVRDQASSRVTLGTEGGREQVERFRVKFLKEARTIARMNHPHIVRIIDVFEENGTAYYVMEYASNGSLSDKVGREGCLREPEATRYIRQLASALEYVHEQKMNHLDVKPANILLNEKEEVVLVDFGLSKQYDAVTGEQTSSTPVGLSEGYAPIEQSKKGGVSEFSPETDIYSMGATFYKLLTGETPPSASDIMEEGLPVGELRSRGVSDRAIAVICKAMKPRKKDRMKSVKEFVEGLEGTFVESSEPPAGKGNGGKHPTPPDEGETLLIGALGKGPKQEPPKQPTPPKSPKKPKPKSKKKWSWVAFGAIVVLAIALAVVWGTPQQPTIKTTTETPLAVRTYTANGVSFQMVYVEGGTFTMGATAEQGSDAYDDGERPAHSVTLSSYYIGQTEVTQALWQAVMGSNPSDFDGDDLPVENVSWDDCQEFVRKLGQITGKNFRLPTEAEWEYAARGGSKSRGYKYSGSDNIGSVAWYDGNSGSETHAVATKSPNELGLYDMSGNVCEWCQDWYGDYSSSAQANPTGPTSGDYRVLRGGSCYSVARFCRVSYRNGSSPSDRGYCLGLRLVLSE